MRKYIFVTGEMCIRDRFVLMKSGLRKALSPP